MSLSTFLVYVTTSYEEKCMLILDDYDLWFFSFTHQPLKILALMNCCRMSFYHFFMNLGQVCATQVFKTWAHVILLSLLCKMYIYPIKINGYKTILVCSYLYLPRTLPFGDNGEMLFLIYFSYAFILLLNGRKPALRVKIHLFHTCV